MRQLARLSVSTLPALLLGSALMASAPACGGDDSDDASATLPDSGGSGGSSVSNPATGSGGSGIQLPTGAGGETFSTTGEGGAGAGECGGQSVDAAPVKVNLLLVIDRSGSMNETPIGFEDDKWTSMVASLDSALDGISGRMALGIQFFPDATVENASICSVPSGGEIAVPIAEGSGAAEAVKNALALEDNAPAGSTPTAAALALAHEYFTTGDGANLEGESYVLLALDGGPNCNGSITCSIDSCTANIDGVCTAPGNASCCSETENAALNLNCLDREQTLAEVEALASAGITTFVVGIPGTDQEPYEVLLDALAVAGGAPAGSGSPKFYRVEDAAELSSTLVALTSDLVNSCELLLDNPPPDAGKVNVFIEDEPLPRFGDDGWDYDDPAAPRSIIIRGETCSRIEAEGVESVRVEYGCKTYEVPK